MNPHEQPEQPAAFFRRGHMSGTMFVALQTLHDAELRAAAWVDQYGKSDPADCLPPPGAARAMMRDGGAWTFGHERGPDVILWSVHPPAEAVLRGGRPRVVYRLSDDHGRPVWRDAGDVGEAELSALEAAVHAEETRPVRQAARREDEAIEARGFLITDVQDDVWVYRQRGFVATERARGGEAWRTPWIPIEIPRRRNGDAMLLAPWCMWIGEQARWRPEYDAALDHLARKRIIAQLSAWLCERGEPVQIVEPLPTAAAPLVIPRATMPAMHMLLEFLLASGCRLAAEKPQNPMYPVTPTRWRSRAAPVHHASGTRPRAASITCIWIDRSRSDRCARRSCCLPTPRAPARSTSRRSA